MKSQIRTYLRHYFGDEHAAKVLYGVILLFVALFGLDASNLDSGYLAATEAFIAIVAIIIAEDYAELIGFTIKNKRTLSRQERNEIFADTFAIATFCLPSVLILLLSESGLYMLGTAFNYTFIYCILVIFVFSYWASKLSNLNRLHSVVTASIVASIGLALVYLKSSFGK